MSHLTIKDLKATLHVLENIDVDVPQSLLVAISNNIKERETTRKFRRMSKMTEEDLIRYTNRARRHLKVTTFDGRLLDFRHNNETFAAALREAGIERVKGLEITVRKHPILVCVESYSRMRMKGYRLLEAGTFIYKGTDAREKVDVLKKIDEELQLNWEIELV